MIPVLLWWLIIQITGWLALPLTRRVFRWLPDQGYASAKAVGLLLISFIVWLGASAGFLRNNLGGIFFAFLVGTGLSIWAWRSSPAAELEPLSDFLQRNHRLVIITEVLFTAAFILWAALRAYAPDKIMSSGGEKFMEIAFLNAILNSPTFPPLDPWLSGFAIAYYYFGYVMMAVITRLSGVPAGVGFELYDALLFALTCLGAFGLVYNLVSASLSQPQKIKPNTQAVNFGMLAALFVAVLGNLEGLLESLRARGILAQSFFDWIAVPDLAKAAVTGAWYPGTSAGWWWWRGSRVIQDVDLAGSALGVSPITEFPFFSFLLGDNHPHVLGLPFVLLAISLAFSLLLHTSGARSQAAAASHVLPTAWWNPVAYCLQGDAALFWFAAVLLGGLAFLNTWDFPIYLGLALLAYAAGQIKSSRRLERTILLRTTLLGAGLLACSIAVYSFFYFSFDSQAGGIVPYIFPPTRLPQYLVMFGTFAFILTGFLIISLAERAAGKSQVWGAALRSWGWTVAAGLAIYGLIALVMVMGSWLSQAFPVLNNPSVLATLGGQSLPEAAGKFFLDRLHNPWLFLFLSVLVALAVAGLQALLTAPSEASPDAQPANSSQVFSLLLALFGLLLTWSVEFVYLRDSFGVRMNTVFKFYYQAWVMLACASAYALWWLSSHHSSYLRPARQVILAGATVLILAGMVYPLMSFPTRAAGFKSEPDLDGTSGIARNNPDDWAAIQWLQLQAKITTPAPVILEAPGKSYTFEGRISAFTGLPSVLGWAIHESQWRGSYDEQSKREPDIAAIYSTHDPGYALELLRKWDVDYVILGWVEQSYIQQLCTEVSRRCNLNSAVRKFNQVLQPVFTQGLTTIYAVPGR